MRGTRRFARSLVLLAFPVLAAAAAWAQGAPCGVAPGGRPWGCELKEGYPPAIYPRGDELSSSLVMRVRKGMFTPVWTGRLCQGTYLVCTADADCTNTPTGKCVDVASCAGNKNTCTSDSECGTQGPCTKMCRNTDQPCKSNSDCTGVRCVGTSTWGWQSLDLRSYGSPIDPAKPIDPANPNDPNLRWGFPGPVFHARAETLRDPARPPAPDNPALNKGTRIKIDLYNYFDPTSYSDAHKCNPANYKACGDLSYCQDSKGNLTNPVKTCTQQSQCPAGNVCLPKTCSNDSNCTSISPDTKCITRPVSQKDPNCYHGNSVTNLHLHGTHVSPQRPQDFVLLNLFPYGSKDVPTGENYALGSYQVDVNPLPWNQPPGTHWYHPHKHGSTSVQVLNGMAGGLIIEGAFDDWLNRFYGGKLVDRVMAVQQISGGVNFFVPGSTPPKSLLNGMATPVITMRPGEIQRWRFVGGTAQASAQLEIGFDPRIKEVRQIAQDGVQFAWQNYDRQPLRDTTGTYNNFKLSPGNRVDFLIKAPDAEGFYTINSRVFTDDISETGEQFFNIDDDTIAERVPPTAVPTGRVPVDSSGNPLLFTILVDGDPEPNPMQFPVTEATDPACKATPKPARCWPDTPYYLRDLDDPGTTTTKLDFKIDGQVANQPNSFWINDSQYQACCAGLTMTLGKTENWLVANKLGKNNTSLLPHPFHIHINPFQVIRNADRTFEPPYIWQDTISLPTPGPPKDRPAGPIYSNEDAQVKCPIACRAENATWNGQWTTTIPGVLSVCGCEQKSDDVAIRHRFDDYTGGYVIHCHFLGHEDRGMMWNIQTVCPGSGNKYGQTQAGGGADNCGVTKPALPQCPQCPPGTSEHSH